MSNRDIQLEQVAEIMEELGGRRTTGLTMPGGRPLRPGEADEVDQDDLAEIDAILDEIKADGPDSVDIGRARRVVEAAKAVPEFWTKLEEHREVGDRGFDRFASILRATQGSVERADAGGDVLGTPGG